MLYIDLERLNALFHVINPKDDKSGIDGLYWDGGKWIACSSIVFMCFKPQEAEPLAAGSFIHYDKKEHIKALLKEFKGRPSVPGDRIAALCTKQERYPDQAVGQVLADTLNRETTTRIHFNIKALIGLHKASTVGAKGLKKDIVTLEFKERGRPLLYRDCNGQEALLAPVEPRN